MLLGLNIGFSPHSTTSTINTLS